MKCEILVHKYSIIMVKIHSILSCPKLLLECIFSVRLSATLDFNTH